MEFRRRESHPLVSFQAHDRSGLWNGRWVALCMLAALGGFRSAPADDNWNAVAPVIELDERDRSTARSTYPAVNSRQEALTDSESDRHSVEPEKREIGSTSDKPASQATLARATEAPVLAPIIRGRPAWSKSKRPSRPVASETAPETHVQPGPTLTYGQTNELLAAVTSDLQESDETSHLNPELADQPKTETFRVDHSGRLLRAGARQTDPCASHFNRELSNATPVPSRIPSRFIGFQPAEIQQPSPPNSVLEPQLPQPFPAESVPPGLATETDNSPAAIHEEFRPIQQVGVDITPGQGAMPQNLAATRFAQAGEQNHRTGFSRSEPQMCFEWDAPALCHRPLFFEDVNLERHGYHVKYAQPLLSAAHFFSRLPAIPYLAASQRTRVCNYTLGHYRPGSSAPYVWYYPRPSLSGTTIEGALVTGLILAIP